MAPGSGPGEWPSGYDSRHRQSITLDRWLPSGDQSAEDLSRFEWLMARGRRKGHSSSVTTPRLAVETPIRHTYRSALRWGLVIGLLAAVGALMLPVPHPDTNGVRGGGLGFAFMTLGPVAAGLLLCGGYVLVVALFDWRSRIDLKRMNDGEPPPPRSRRPDSSQRRPGRR